MADSAFDLSAGLLAGTAATPARFAGFPPYMFVGGNNDPDCVPVEGLVKAAADVLVRHGSNLAIYNLGMGPQGYPPLRDHLASKLNRHRGMTITADDVLITTGSNQGIDLACELFVGPGDVVLIEALSYSGALGRFRKRGARLVPMPLDEEGIVVDAVAEKLAALKAEGVTPKLLYTIPTIQNPTGTIMPLARRHKLVALARQYGVPILEDECYADLTWAGIVRPPSIYSLDPACVIHIGSFSKSIAPALRLGYVVADWSIIGRMAALKSDGGTGALDQMITAEFCADGFDAHVGELAKTLRGKMEATMDAVEQQFGTLATVRRPDGGIFVWIGFPPEIDVRRLVAPAAKAGVSFNAGPEWAAEPESASNWLRLCFAMPSNQTIYEGVAKLAEVCHEVYGVPKFSANTKRGSAE
jgi:2-aminoadipate transaminase